MHAALRQVLGTHVSQKGSLVNDKVLRFDFSHNEAMKPEEIRAVEDLVNAQIRRNLPIETNIMDLEAAKAKGAMALFGEKYDERVRVLSMGDFSTELCGGTHASRTGDIGLFRIISESGTAARRSSYRSGNRRRRYRHRSCRQRSLKRSRASAERR